MDANRWSRAGNCQQKETLLWCSNKLQWEMCLLLGDGWVKGPGVGEKEVRCSGVHLGRQYGQSVARVRRVTGLAPHHFQCMVVPAELAFLSSRTSPYCVHMSQSLLPFRHFSSSCLTHYPSSSSSFTHSQRLCPQNYPDSSLKRSARSH